MARAPGDDGARGASIQTSKAIVNFSLRRANASGLSRIRREWWFSSEDDGEDRP